MKDNLPLVAINDITVLSEKEKSYGDSWKKRGGVGAFMMLARKWDRIENQCATNNYDIFQCDPNEKDGLLDDISDLRRYLLLVESEITERYHLKNGIQDLEKARHFIDKLIELESIEGIKDDDQNKLSESIRKGLQNPYANIDQDL